MFANKLMVPFVLVAALFLGLAWGVDDSYSIYFVPFLVIAALIFILSPQINWWWYSRNPPELSTELRTFLERSCGYYRRLSMSEQRRFRGRVAMFNMGTDWEPLAFPEDSLPPDVQVAIAAQAVTLTFAREQFLFDKFEKVIIFPRPFPTPEHPYDHASEMHETDGCLLFSADQVMKAFVKPTQWYNVAMHEYAKAFMLKYPNEPWPNFSSEDVRGKIRGRKRDATRPRGVGNRFGGCGCTSGGGASFFHVSRAVFGGFPGGATSVCPKIFLTPA